MPREPAQAAMHPDFRSHARRPASRRAITVVLACAAWAGAAGFSTVAAAATASQQWIPAPSQPGPAPATAGPGQGPAAAASPQDDATPPASEQWVEQQTARVRAEVEARVGRGEMNPDEAERLIGWRHWQFQQQAAGLAPASQIPGPPRVVQHRVAAAPPLIAAPVVPAPMLVGPPVAPAVGIGIGGCIGGGGHNGAFSLCF